MRLVVQKDLQQMTAPETVFYGCSCNTIDGHILANYRLDSQKTVIGIAIMSEIEYSFLLTVTNMEEIGAALQVSNFFPGISLAICKWDICVIETMLRCSGEQ